MSYTAVFIDLKKFKDDGLLRQVNEEWFWPRGLALTVSENDEGYVSLYGIQDMEGKLDPDGNPYGPRPKGGDSK